MGPIISRRGEGEILRNPVGGPLEIKARGAETGGAVTMIESVAAPGEGPPLHVHADADEVLYFIDGPFRVEIEGEIHEAPPGTFVFIPRNVVHTWQNVSADPSRLLALFTPSSEGMEGFFEGFSRSPEGVPVPEAFAAAAEGSQMGVVGPPLSQR